MRDGPATGETPAVDLADQLAAITREADVLADVVAAHPDVAVPACPGWDVAELGRHTGGAHRWALANIATDDPTHHSPVRATPPTDPAEVPAWVRDGAAELTRTIAADPEARRVYLGDTFEV